MHAYLYLIFNNEFIHIILILGIFKNTQTYNILKFINSF